MGEGIESNSLFAMARACLGASELESKLVLVLSMRDEWQAGGLSIKETALPDVRDAGRPARPQLVHPRELPRRSTSTQQGRLALIHAVAHIEFNAINLACDAVFRFQQMPRSYYDDWVRVAAEEAEHFSMLRGYLIDEDCDYGDFPGHNGLWDMALRTAEDPLTRMAMVPRMLEARGLDVTPGMIERFRILGDTRMVEILSLILKEEIGHVEIGSRWFHYLCAQRGLEPERTYLDLLTHFLNGEIRCPLNLKARRQAGFSETELESLLALCG